MAIKVIDINKVEEKNKYILYKAYIYIFEIKYLKTKIKFYKL